MRRGNMRRAHGSSTCTRYCASTGLESSWCYSWPAACGGGFFAKARFGTHTLSRHSKYHVRRPRRSRLVISEKPGVKLAPQEVPRTCRIPDGALSHSPDMVVRAAAVAISSSVSTPLARPDPAPTRFFNRLTAVAALVGGGRDGSADGARRGGRGVGGCVVVAPGALLAPRRR